MKKICEGPITAPFGTRRDLYMPTTWRSHNGVDIEAPKGTAVYSPVDGLVVSTFINPRGGKTLLLRSDCGTLRFGFCHLQGFYVMPGQIVRKGEKVALSGGSGVCLVPHLHFSLKKGGKWDTQNDYIGGRWADPSDYIDIEA